MYRDELLLNILQAELGDVGATISLRYGTMYLEKNGLTVTVSYTNGENFSVKSHLFVSCASRNGKSTVKDFSLSKIVPVRWDISNEEAMQTALNKVISDVKTRVNQMFDGVVRVSGNDADNKISGFPISNSDLYQTLVDVGFKPVSYINDTNNADNIQSVIFEGNGRQCLLSEREIYVIAHFENFGPVSVKVPRTKQAITSILENGFFSVGDEDYHVVSGKVFSFGQDEIDNRKTFEANAKKAFDAAQQALRTEPDQFKKDFKDRSASVSLEMIRAVHDSAFFISLNRSGRNDVYVRNINASLSLGDNGIHKMRIVLSDVTIDKVKYTMNFDIPLSYDGYSVSDMTVAARKAIEEKFSILRLTPVPSQEILKGFSDDAQTQKLLLLAVDNPTLLVPNHRIECEIKQVVDRNCHQEHTHLVYKNSDKGEEIFFDRDGRELSVESFLAIRRTKIEDKLLEKIAQSKGFIPTR